MAKTKAEIRTEVKDAMVARIHDAMGDGVVQIGDYTYAIPMGTAEDNGKPIYAKVEIKCANWYDTKNTKAFDPEEKVVAYHAEILERERKEAEREAKRAEK